MVNSTCIYNNISEFTDGVRLFSDKIEILWQFDDSD